MKIWFISDTHNEHLGLQVPQADMDIHCGDESTQKKTELNEPESRRFFDWYANLDIATKVFVPGNHSTAIAQGKVTPVDYPDVHFLLHESITLSGLRLFGSPYTPVFHDWAYMQKRSRMDQAWQKVPADTDILITHGPPKGVLDLTHDMNSTGLAQVGCAALRRHVENRITPAIHAFGHLHDEKGINNYGMYSRGATQYINCACCDLTGKLMHNGFVIDLADVPPGHDRFVST